MKVLLEGGASEKSGGMYRVFQSIRNYLPVEFVDSVEEADVIHAHIAVYKDYPVDKPLVVSSHGLLWNDVWGNSKAAKHVNKLAFESYHQADVVTAPSQFVANAISRHISIPVKVVHHGIDLNEWKPGINKGYVLWNKTRQDLANDPTIVNKLAKMLPEVQFVTTIGEPANNVEVIGVVSPEEIKTIVQGASVYVDTPKESGGPCFGLLEALACGVPAVSYNVGGSVEVIEHKYTGFIADDLLGMAEGIQYCLENRTRMRKLVLYEAQKYAIEKTVLGYLEAYQQAMQEYPVDVSVIIPCYNLGKFVGRAIQSALDQNYPSMEVIVINDASTDNSYEEIERFRDDSRVTIIHNKQNLHVSDSRNIGIATSKGHYILPLDADDWLPAGTIKSFVNELNKTRKIDAVAGKLIIYDENENKWGESGWPNGIEWNLQLQGYNRLPYSTMYRRKVWENLGGYRRRIRTGIEDADLWTRFFSFGYSAKLISRPTLNYTNRSDGLGKSGATSEDWLSWFGWSFNPEIIPGGVVPENSFSFDPPDVSVIIPVGPGHEHHIQTCLDSLLAQTFSNWEAVVVNDTGKSLDSFYTMGFPYVTFLNERKQTGVAGARNDGIRAARSERIIFLDVDDIAQPEMIELFLETHNMVDGYIYADWYANRDGELDFNEAPDWNSRKFTQKPIAPITGIYWKGHLELIGGFDVEALGWEDWEMQLRLFKEGICGTRLAVPVIVYNIHLGDRREENFKNKENVLEYIKDKHRDILNGRFKQKMACKSCGGKKTVVRKPVTTSTAQKEDTMITVVYNNPDKIGNFHLKSKAVRGHSYKVVPGKPFLIHDEDADQVLSMSGFTRVEQSVIQKIERVQEKPIVAETPKEVEVPDYIKKKLLIEDLDLPEAIIRRLKQHYTTVPQLKKATDEELLAISGIGEGRLEEIRACLNS